MSIFDHTRSTLAPRVGRQHRMGVVIPELLPSFYRSAMQVCPQCIKLEDGVCGQTAFPNFPSLYKCTVGQQHVRESTD